MFGSYSWWWNAIPNNENDIKYFRLKIRERHSNINFLLENIHMKSADLKNIIHDALQYLKEESKMEIIIPVVIQKMLLTSIFIENINLRLYIASIQLEKN